ncbi:hypothetical protein BHM03_00055872 [Ensete ventricosum]|nr:hypothetical protein BHM03_00055872 [Ensete ventricosum]
MLQDSETDPRVAVVGAASRRGWFARDELCGQQSHKIVRVGESDECIRTNGRLRQLTQRDKTIRWLRER